MLENSTEEDLELFLIIIEGYRRKKANLNTGGTHNEHE